MRVLLIDDNVREVHSIKRVLESKDFILHQTESGEDGIQIAKLYEWDVILLDWSLSDMTGHEVLRTLRTEKVITPVIVLSDYEDVETKVIALNVGADNCVTKPFHADELVACINAIVRRSNSNASSVIIVGQIAVDLVSMNVDMNGQRVRLASKPFRLLKLFMLKAGSVVTRDMISDHVYGGDNEPDSNTSGVLVYKLRRKIKETTRADYIETRYCEGYVFKEPSS